MPKSDIRSYIQYNPDTGSFKWISTSRPAGCYNDRGYLKIRFNRVRYSASRLAWYLTYGEWPKGVIDHIDRNPSNNKLSNLRDASHSLNSMNHRSRSQSGLPRGIFKDREGYRVRLSLLGEPVSLGTYKTLEEAQAVAEIAYEKQVELAEKDDPVAMQHFRAARERERAARERKRAAKKALIDEVVLEVLGL